MRVGLGSVMLVLTLAMCLLADHPVQAKTKSAPLRRSFFVASPSFAGYRQAPNKVFPKVDPKDEIPLPEGTGKDTTKRVCGNCHSTNIWIKQRHTAVKWSSIIDNMLSKGMEASDDDINTVNDYLGTYLLPPPKDPAAPATPPPPPK
jgi:hypothetical protein